MTTSPELDHLRKIATPSAFGRAISQKLWGGPYRVDPWLAHMESSIVPAILDPNKRFIAYNTPPQIGKLLALTMEIPTPNGFTAMGDLRLGDEVMGADGRPCKVTVVSEVQIREAYRVVFDDGSELLAGPEHQWMTLDESALKAYNGRRREGTQHFDYDHWWDWRSRTGITPRVRTTEDIASSVLVGSDDRCNHTIPTAAPLDLPEAELPIDPWVLGYWLGNGSKDCGVVTCGSLDGETDYPHVAEKIRAAGYRISETTRGREGVATFTVFGLIGTLRDHGILCTRAIPPAYLRSSASQRLALLHGLMDSDGGPENKNRISGSVSFSSMDEHLTAAVSELAVSLGAKTHRNTKRAKLNGIDHGLAHRVFFTPAFCPFTLPRKARFWASSDETGRHLQRLHRKIVKVERTGVEMPMRCISVDSPGNLYLAGESMIPTHNTTYSGILVPSWCTGMFPHKQTIFISYSDDYSLSRGKLVREVMESFGREMFGVSVSNKFAAGGDWKLEGFQGGMLSVGIGSQITGRSGDIVIVDDLIKNMEEAGSQTAKRKHADEFFGTILSRVQDDSTYILTSTRWAEDDLTGTLKEVTSKAGYSGYAWEFVNFPAIAEPSEDEVVEEEDEGDWRDVLGRSIGEELQTRFSPGHWEMIRRSTDPFVWNCLYQGMPSIREGGMFPPNMWRYYKPGEEPQLVRHCRVWDLAATEGGGDWTVGLLMARAVSGDLYVIEVERFQKSPNQVEATVRECARRDGYSTKIKIEQERSGSGKSLIEIYQRILPGHIVEPAKAEGSKESRATPASSMQNQGRIWLPEGAPWVKQFLEETKKLMGDGRRPRHDDQIDCLAYAALELIESGAGLFFDPSSMNLEAESQMFALLEQHGGNRGMPW